MKDLRVRFRTLDGAVEAVKGINLHVNAGETVAIVGESGSGKSQTMMAAMRLLASNGEATGVVDYRGRNLLTLGKSEHQPGPRPQDHHDLPGADDLARSALFDRQPADGADPQASRLERRRGARRRRSGCSIWCIFPHPERRMKAYPHELSGGQRQRVMIAMALANDPDILIADEPTTALDVTIQAQILALLAELQARLGMAIVFITHDLGIVRRFADRVYVMQSGVVVEEGDTETIFAASQHPYTQMLLAAEPTGRKAPPPASAPILLEGRNVEVVFRIGGGFLAGAADRHPRRRPHLGRRCKRARPSASSANPAPASRRSGARLLKLLPSEGVIRFESIDISKADRQQMPPLRRELQVVFQDPFGSLSPRMTVGQIVTEGLLVHEPSLSGKERDRRAVEALKEVGLDPNARNRYPHEFSGGQRQRIAIARAMILKPKVMVLDEPTSALDRSVQKQIVELLRSLQRSHDLSYLFISHDLAVVRAMADYIIVMKSGKIVEEGPTEAIFDHPRDEYTQALMAAAIDSTRFRQVARVAG